MCPYAEYKIGHEKGAGQFGNAPLFLTSFTPLEITLAALALLPLVPLITIPFTLYGVFQWLVVSVSIAVAIQIGTQLILRRHYRKVYTNSELEQILSRVNRQMGFSSEFELWEYSSDKPVLAPVSALLYRALVISKPAEEDLLASPEMAETVLADQLKDMQSGHTISTGLPIFIFVLVASFLVQWTGLPLGLAVNIVWALFFVFVIVIGWTVLVGKDNLRNVVLEVYGVHPDMARCVVFRGFQPTKAEMRDILKRPIDPLSKDVFRMKAGISYFAALFLSLLAGMALNSWVSNLFPPDYPIILEVVYFLPIGVSVFVFLALFGLAVRVRYEYPDSNSDMQSVPKFDKT